MSISRQTVSNIVNGGIDRNRRERPSENIPVRALSSLGAGVAGQIDYNRKSLRVVGATIPSPTSALARVIAQHELIHGARPAMHAGGSSRVANRQIAALEREYGRERAFLAINAVEDSLVQSRFCWPMQSDRPRLARDTLAVALRDWRSATRFLSAWDRGEVAPSPQSIAQQRAAVVSLIRAFSILDRYGRYYGCERTVRPLLTGVCSPTVDTCKSVALRVVTAYRKMRVNPAKARRAMLTELRCAAGALSPDLPALLIDLDSRESSGVKKLPESPLDDASAIDLTGLKIRYWRLSLTVGVQGALTSRRGYAGRLNVRDLIRARTGTAGASAKFWRERVYRGRGTVLIDGSGSMGWSLENLVKILDSLPAALVAVYSGFTGGGEVVTVSDRGRRAGDRLDGWKPYGGNWIDLFALRWLIRQPGPHVLVSDLRFCGGQGCVEAYKLVKHLSTVGKLTVYDSFESYTAGKPTTTFAAL